MRSHRKILAAACGGAVLLSALFAAGIAQAGDEVPFKVTAVTKVTAEVPGTFPVLATIITEGSGTSTHQGKITVDGEVTLTWTPSGILIEGTGTSIGANGDAIYTSLSALSTAEPGNLEGTFEITGGTGRFAGATGSGTVVGTLNEAGDAQTAVYEGTIDYKKK